MKLVLKSIPLFLITLLLLTGCNEEFIIENGNSSTNQSTNIPAIPGNYLQTTLYAGDNYSYGFFDGIGTDAHIRDVRGMLIAGNELFIGDQYKLRKINLSNLQVTTLAGTGGWGDADGDSQTSIIGNTMGLQFIGDQLYFGDFQNRKIKKMDPSRSIVSVSTQSMDTAYINGMTKIGTDLYYVRAHSVWSYNTLSNTATLIAGDTALNGTADGLGSAARFNSATDITTDGTDLYITDCGNNAIRKLKLSTSEVTTLSGTLGVGGYIEGDASTARYNCPHHIKYHSGNLYVIDLNNYIIRSVDPTTGESHFIAGQQGLSSLIDGVGSSASFLAPKGIEVNDDFIFISDETTIRRINLINSSVSTIIGSTNSVQYIDGPFGIGQLKNSNYMTTNGTDLFLTDDSEHTIRKITSSGHISTIAGNFGVSGSLDAQGTSAQFDYPTGIYADGEDIYVLDSGNYTIRKIDKNLNVTTIAGQVGVSDSVDGIGASALFDYPLAITKKGEDLYVLDGDNNLTTTLRKITPSGQVTTVAGDKNDATWDCQPGPDLSAKLTGAYSIVNVGENFYIPICNYIFKIDSDFNVTIFAGDGTNDNAEGFSTLAKISNPSNIASDGIYLYTMARNQLARIRIADGHLQFIGGVKDEGLEHNGSINNRAIPNCKSLVFNHNGLFCSSHYGVYRFH